MLHVCLALWWGGAHLHQQARHWAPDSQKENPVSWGLKDRMGFSPRGVLELGIQGEHGVLEGRVAWAPA